MRLFFIIFGLTLVIASWLALDRLNPDRAPRILAHTAGNPIPLFTEALRRDSGSPYRWADLADGYLAAGRAADARAAYLRAGTLANGIPQIWVRAANFFFAIDDRAEALRCAAHALRLAADYDPVLFVYFDRLLDTDTVLAGIGNDRRPTLAYLEHLIALNHIDAAESAWNWAWRKGFAGSEVTAAYIDALLRNRRYSHAQRDWAAYFGNERGDYLSPNLVFNSSFELAFSGSALDWGILPSDKFETIRDPGAAHTGQFSLQIRFRGTENVYYANVVQTVPLVAGRYRFEAWVRSDSLTTNQGPQFQIYDTENLSRLDVRTSPITGSHEWTLVTQPITIASGTNLVALKVLRDLSAKFDNKISGSLWIDDIRLIPE